MYVTINNTKYMLASYRQYIREVYFEFTNGEELDVYTVKNDINEHIKATTPFVVRNGNDIKIEEFNLRFDRLLQVIQNFNTGNIEVYISYDDEDRYDDKEALNILIRDSHPSVKEARKLRAAIEQFTTFVDDDELAVANSWAYPEWVTDHDYKAGDKAVDANVLYKCLADHTSQDTWNPAAAPSLWAKVIDETPTGEYPVWEQPDSTNSYHVGDIVWFPTKGTKLYESLIDNNVWSPEAYPAGWKEVNP